MMLSQLKGGLKKTWSYLKGSDKRHTYRSKASISISMKMKKYTITFNNYPKKSRFNLKSIMIKNLLSSIKPLMNQKKYSIDFMNAFQNT